jgi:glycosyltransferase involved in cell wall biosynthesis
MMLSSSSNPVIVSVIIPCYNHSRYLSKAIGSVLSQDYIHHEIIVVDDGSIDDTRSVAQSYETVKYIYKSNQGLSAARNTGIENSTGDFLVFLDADDWLFNDALSTNMHYLNDRPDVAFVSGAFTDVCMHYGYQVKTNIKKDHYLLLLERNYIAMHATVMYRRQAFDNLRYDTSLKACEDYDIYLKMARKYPVIHHTRQVAVYNRHDANMSANYPMMLEYALLVLNRQKDSLINDTEREHFKKGIQFWIDHYCINIHANLSKGNGIDDNKKKPQLDTLKQYRKDLYFKHLITEPFMQIKKSLLKHNFNFLLKFLYKAGLYKNFIPAQGKIAMGDFNRTTPFSKVFGYDRGGPVDRYYIENFLKKQSTVIHGRVLEIGDNEYTLKFGGLKVSQSDILHIDSDNAQATFTGDLSNAPHLPADAFDCIVLTQTLHLIYNYKAALQTCYRILKPGGTLLLTVPGICHIDQGEWRKIWLYSFTDSSITKVLSEIFPVERIEVETFGNVLVATAFLFGVGLPELKTEQMNFNDPHYQVIIAATAVKPTLI